MKILFFLFGLSEGFPVCFGGFPLKYEQRKEKGGRERCGKQRKAKTRGKRKSPYSFGLVPLVHEALKPHFSLSVTYIFNIYHIYIYIFYRSFLFLQFIYYLYFTDPFLFFPPAIYALSLPHSTNEHLVMEKLRFSS